MPSAKYDFKLDLAETISLGEEQVTDPPVLHTIANASGTLDANSGVPVTLPWSDEAQLSGGTLTLDLAALARLRLADINFTGLKVQLVKIVAHADNTAVIIVKPAASNGYFLFGDADGQWTGAAGAITQTFGNESLPDVGASAKDITITSSDVDAKFHILLAAG